MSQDELDERLKKYSKIEQDSDETEKQYTLEEFSQDFFRYTINSNSAGITSLPFPKERILVLLVF